MPGIDGYTLAHRVRHELRLNVRLVAVTGWGQQADKDKALAAGFDHHFTKPVEPDELIGLLRAMGRE